MVSPPHGSAGLTSAAAGKKGMGKFVKLALGWFGLYFLYPGVLSISSAQCLEFRVKDFGCSRVGTLYGLVHLK